MSTEGGECTTDCEVVDVFQKVAQREHDSGAERVQGESFETAAESSPKAKVQLRPVGHPSPVTQLFEYTVKAWNNQKGDHCTYRYMPSRDPTAPMEMIATVLVRLPNKQPLYVKDSKPRASRVIAQNSVAQLALEKLALEDSELASALETIKKEQEAASRQPQYRQPSSPWRPPRQYRHAMPHYYPPQYPYFVPTDNGEGEFMPPPPPPMFYPMMPLQSFESDEGAMSQEHLMTPTYGAPYAYGYPPIAPFMPPPEMMYYAPPMMMPSNEHPHGEQEPADPTVY